MADIVGAGAYRAGRTTRLAGISGTASTLTIRLAHASRSLPARIAMPYFCAVPPNTPIRPGGLKQVIPSAGPYYIVSHTPGSALVLRRNPSYHGQRPRRFDEIDYHFGATPAHDAALVEAGRADYADDELGQLQSPGAVSPTVDTRLERGYGPHSPAARSGRQRYFVNRNLTSVYLLLNARRPLFSSARMRRAVNFAVDRPALARNALAGFSSVPTDQYLPPGTPGFRDADIYPLGGPDVARARSLAGTHGGHAVMYTCNTATCRSVGETVKSDLRAIGITVEIKQFPYAVMFDRETKVRMSSHGQLVADFPRRALRHRLFRMVRRLRRPVAVHRRVGPRVRARLSRRRRPALPTAHRRRRQTRRGPAPARLRSSRRRPRHARRPRRRLRRRHRARLLLRTHRLPDVPAVLRHGPGRSLHQAPMSLGPRQPGRSTRRESRCPWTRRSLAFICTQIRGHSRCPAAEPGPARFRCGGDCECLGR